MVSQESNFGLGFFHIGLCDAALSAILCGVLFVGYVEDKLFELKGREM
jgi:hypothetical protein